VYAAIYQKNLKIGYVESLLQKVDRAFSKEYADEKNVPIDFEESFMVLLEDAETEKKEAAVQPKKDKQEEQQRQQENEAADTGAEEELVDEVEIGKAGEGEDGPAFNAEVLKKKMLGKKGGAPTIQPKKGDAKKKGKKARQWNDFGIEQSVPETNLDFTEGAPPEEATMQQQVESFQQMSLMDVEEEVSDVESEEDEPSGGKSSSLLSSFVRNIGVNVMGTQALSREDIDPSLQDLKKKLMERNVAEEIANKLIESVAASLVGQKLSSFTRVSSAVRKSVEEALVRILTPKKSIDILRGVKESKARGKPYVIVFVGVNGVGKSTNLSKVAYWLLQNHHKVMIAACDTFRSGAVEQLKTHCTRLGVSLYERGYEKDPAKVAFEATKAAQREGCDVVLVDTAGRMQDNEPLMRALSNLISFNSPDLVLFVGEALVGNDAVDQLTKFNKRLADLASDPDPHLIDGIVLTKFDTIDEKVGAALSMVYTSGAPIVFVGCGQTYVDLKRLNVKSVVNSLLK